MGGFDIACNLILSACIILGGVMIISQEKDCCKCVLTCAEGYITQNEANLTWGRVYESEGINKTIEEAKKEARTIGDGINSLNECSYVAIPERGEERG